ncbi:PH domain-containing protein [Bacillus sp. SG-1]|uniref:PH domain-containing protein n=1 Tax=Bacillus sp. SG-1 TaxID=161544 RepID=UPI00015430D8|nr:PH domain-containing protein [Bacillus sp. SG-1]EDL66267.1 hypothetical protein BSG1_02905 [Bacillus sp. SG-1]
MKFKSRKDLLFYIIFWGSIIGILLTEISNNEYGLTAWLLKALAGFLLIILLWIWFGTCYIFKEQKLLIRYGPFRWRILIKDIKSIRKVKSPFTSPALAVNRLEIYYQKYEVVQISPQDQDAFINYLCNQNQNIKLETL